MTSLRSLTIPWNRDTVIPLTFTDKATGNAIDITAKTITFNVKKVLDQDVSDAELAFSKTAIIVSGTQGTASVTILAADTLPLVDGQYNFDIQYDANKTPSRVMPLLIRKIVKNG
jgi:hypothetical protein